ncbi:DMT family transporter [Baekduia soli]|uniref:DMT family transporter n=1 Tax=Baekduia soli TaxID=496014 RepID=A0A5B8U2L9_9ACTN|nr:DMT family transporter [Baekduia soli]QEC47172.1 DMT family transporter [Baekduia soli]
MTVVLAIAAAASWGLADFLAGLASRRVAVPVVLALVEGGGLVVVLAVTLAVHEPFFSDRLDAVGAIAGGLSGVLALGLFYRALAIGTMSIVAPISAAGSAVAVVVGVAAGDRPSAIAAVGLAGVFAGVVLASREASDDDPAGAADRRLSVLLALGAAVGFGGFFALTASPARASVLWMLVLARASALPFVLALVARTRPALPGRRLGLGLAAVGLVDLAATAFIGLADRHGDLSVVAVLGGMYPVVTVLLAAAVLGERLRAAQLLGVTLALTGVAAVAAS